MDLTEKRCERERQRAGPTKWSDWAGTHKKLQAGLVKPDACKILQILQRMEMLHENATRVQQTGRRCEGQSVLPSRLLLNIFQYLSFQDWLTCAEVCCSWKSLIQSGTLWSQINFSVRKCWATDGTVQQILLKYRPFVIRLNLRGCASLKWNSLKCISECRNLQEINFSECVNITDKMVERIVEACPSLLYLNLSFTLITNKTLRELSRYCVNLQYLSLAYCHRFTDNGFMYLSTGKGCRNLIHLNLSGCTQMTVTGFRYISAGCPSLREIVIDDMITLSDSCVLALIARCRCLSAMSLLDAPHLSDMAFRAIAEVAKLKTFTIQGNNQITDISLKALCSSSPGLHRLHAAQCPRITDASLTSMANLKNLQHLDISLCNSVSDYGIKILADGASSNNLRELNVSHCSNITNVSVRRIAQRMFKLYHLNLSHCERVTDRSLELLTGSSIRSLNVSGCNIQDQGLAALQCVCLKRLVLAECVCVTDAGIETLCKNLRDLEHVDVSHCTSLSDAAVRSISFCCRSLRTLKMSSCPKMTDMAIQYLTSGSQYLQELDVSGCVLLTDRSLRHLERISPPLCSVSMLCCSSISRMAALRLQPRLERWEHSSEDPLFLFK